MISHQHPGMNSPPGPIKSLRDNLQKIPPIILILENRLPPVAMSHDVVERARIFQSQTPRHHAIQSATQPTDNCFLRTDPNGVKISIH